MKEAMSDVSELQNISSRIEALLQEIRGVEGSPSYSPIPSKVQFDGSRGGLSTARRLTFTPEKVNTYHAARTVPSQTVDGIAENLTKELQHENEKTLKLELALTHVQKELNTTKEMANDVTQSKRLALAMLKQLHNEYRKLQQKYQQSIRNLQHRGSPRSSQDSSLSVQERRLSSLSKQLQYEASKRIELEKQLNNEKYARSSLQESLNKAVQQTETLKQQIKQMQLEAHPISSDELTFHDCQEELQHQSVKQEHVQKSADHKEHMQENSDTDEINYLKKRCTELEKQLAVPSTMSQELSSAQKRCNELELQLKEYTDIVPELNDYRERLKKNNKLLNEVQHAFTQLQDAFKAAKAESNMRLEEKDKLINGFRDNENLMIRENETLREIVKDLNALAQSYLVRIQDLSAMKVKHEEVLEQKTQEIIEKEKSVSDTGCELKALFNRCSEQEKQIEELQTVIDSLESQFGHLTVESAAYVCKSVLRQECLEDDIEKNWDILKDNEQILEDKNKLLKKQSEAILQLRCKLLNQEREIQDLQAELDSICQDRKRNEEVANTHMHCKSAMEQLRKERDLALQSAKTMRASPPHKSCHC